MNLSNLNHTTEEDEEVDNYHSPWSDRGEVYFMFLQSFLLSMGIGKGVYHDKSLLTCRMVNAESKRS